MLTCRYGRRIRRRVDRVHVTRIRHRYRWRRRRSIIRIGSCRRHGPSYASACTTRALSSHGHWRIRAVDLPNALRIRFMPTRRRSMSPAPTPGDMWATWRPCSCPWQLRWISSKRTSVTSLPCEASMHTIVMGYSVCPRRGNRVRVVSFVYIYSSILFYISS